MDASGSSSFVALLPYDDTAAASARRLMTGLLTRIGAAPSCIEDATLVVHELVINGLVHGAPGDGHQIEVSGRVMVGAVEISVLDCGESGTVAARPSTLDRPSGRGLGLVSALTSTWRVDRTSGTRVTAHVPLGQTGQALGQATTSLDENSETPV